MIFFTEIINCGINRADNFFVENGASALVFRGERNPGNNIGAIRALWICHSVYIQHRTCFKVPKTYNNCGCSDIDRHADGLLSAVSGKAFREVNQLLLSGCRGIGLRHFNHRITFQHGGTCQHPPGRLIGLGHLVVRLHFFERLALS